MTFSRSQLSGKWHNQHGSEIRIEVAEDGRLTGTFESATGFAKDKPCPLVGFATETLIAFTVDFSKYDSLTSWTGHCVVEEGEPVVHASWHMSVASRQHSGKWLRSFGSSTRSTVQEKLCIQSSPSFSASILVAMGIVLAERH